MSIFDLLNSKFCSFVYLIWIHLFVDETIELNAAANTDRDKYEIGYQFLGCKGSTVVFFDFEIKNNWEQETDACISRSAKNGHNIAQRWNNKSYRICEAGESQGPLNILEFAKFLAVWHQ